MRPAPFPIVLVGTVLLCGCAAGEGTIKNANGIDPVMQRFMEMEQQLHDVVLQNDVEGAADLLARTLKKEPELEDVCHGLSHIIGEAAYKKYGYEQALLYENDICGSGYIHGVIESYLSTVRDIEKEILTLCPRNAVKCYHGIGHGLMDRSGNDLPGSLVLCDTLPDRRDKIQCAEGVFMENVEADPIVHPTQYLRDDDAFFPCRGQSNVNEGVCAFYAPRSFIKQHPRQYEEALAWCETIEKGPRDACIKGVGDVAAKQNITNPFFVQDLCDKAAPERRHYCMEGLVSYRIVHFASAQKGGELCPQLKEEYRAVCEKVVRESEAFYPG